MVKQMESKAETKYDVHRTIHGEPSAFLQVMNDANKMIDALSYVMHNNMDLAATYASILSGQGGLPVEYEELIGSLISYEKQNVPYVKEIRQMIEKGKRTLDELVEKDRALVNM